MNIRLKNLTAVVGWAVALLLALQVATLPGDWEHSVCGPWGCGPPVQALVGWHLAWLVLLLPMAWSARRLPRRVRNACGLSVMGLAVTGVLLIAWREWVEWLPQVSESLQQYYPHRVGFVLVTWVELPLLELFPAGLLLWRAPGARPKPCVEGGSGNAGERFAAAEPAAAGINEH